MAEQAQYPTGAMLIEMTGTPAWREGRNESVMAMAEQFGVDAAVEVMDFSETRRRIMYGAFADEPIAPPVQAAMDYAVGVMVAGSYDWSALEAAHHAEQAARARPEPAAEVEPEEDERLATGTTQAQGLLLKNRVYHITTDMHDDGYANGIDDATDTEYTIQRFRK